MVSGKAPSCLFPTERDGAMVNVSMQMAEEFTCWERKRVFCWCPNDTPPANQILQPKEKSSLGIMTFIFPHHGNYFPQPNLQTMGLSALLCQGSLRISLDWTIWLSPEELVKAKHGLCFCLTDSFLSSLRVCAKENFKLKWLLICIFIWFFLLKMICIWKLSRSLWIQSAAGARAD